MPKADDREILTVAGRVVTISNPRRALLPDTGHTQLDLARDYLAVAHGALHGADERLNSTFKAASPNPLSWSEAAETSSSFRRVAKKVSPIELSRKPGGAIHGGGQDDE
jgi:hypothetical protein